MTEPPKPHLDITEGETEEKTPAKYTQAVAVTYDEQRDNAPRVVAKGKGHLAEQILALAFAHGVKVREDATLVEILSALEVESPIPLEAYAAVAEILSYVYQANHAAGKKAQP